MCRCALETLNPLNPLNPLRQTKRYKEFVSPLGYPDYTRRRRNTLRVCGRYPIDSQVGIGSIHSPHLLL
jgi:hypothetical protein